MSKSKAAQATAASTLAKTGKKAGIELTEGQMGQAVGGLKVTLKI